MSNQKANKLIFPLKTEYEIGLKFGKDSTYDQIHWGIHLGEDFYCPAGTEIFSIGNGVVVYSDFHEGGPEKRNWGNIIIIAHQYPKSYKYFFSLYGHLGKRFALKGKIVEMGELIGEVGEKNTPENGWWDKEHLHFAIYTGKWDEHVLPGYFKVMDKKTQFKYWKNPSEFVRNYG